MIDQAIIKELNDRFLGKRILVENNEGRFAGYCTFIGNNEFFPSYELQVTIDRTPVTNVRINSIRLAEEKKIF